MKTVNSLIEKLYQDARNRMVEKTKDKALYKGLLKDLLLQGLIKLMEAEVTIQCRKSDLDVVKSIIDPAVKEYKEIMQREVEAFKGKDLPCKVLIDEKKSLPEYDSREGVESCIGGIVLHCRKGRIVCSNTLDERLQLCYQEAVPDIRRMLFPSIQAK